MAQKTIQTVWQKICVTGVVGLLYATLTLWFFCGFETQVSFFLSPIQGIAPALCLYFGGPAMVGCVVGELCVLYLEPLKTLGLCLMTLGALFLFNALPYGMWYLVFRKAEHPEPRPRSTATVAFALGLFYSSLALLALLLGPIQGTLIETTVRAYHLFPIAGFGWPSAVGSAFAIFPTLDLLVIVGLGRTAFCPAIPSWAKREKQLSTDNQNIEALAEEDRSTKNRPETPLTQSQDPTLTEQFILVFTALIALYLLACCFDSVVEMGALIFLGEGIQQTLDFFAFAGGTWYLLMMDLSLTLSLSAWAVAFAWAFCLVVCRFIEMHHTRPIERLAASTRHFTQELSRYQAEPDPAQRAQEREHLLAPALKATAAPAAQPAPDQEIIHLAQTMDAMREAIVTYADQLKEIVAAQERAAADLDLAARIQQSAVTREFDPLRETYAVEIAASLQPARKVGGAFYDVFSIDKHRLGLVIGNVAATGLPAALFMMEALSTIRETLKTTSRTFAIGQALTLINHELFQADSPPTPVEAFVAILDATSGHVSYGCAGVAQNTMAWIATKRPYWAPVSSPSSPVTSERPEPALGVHSRQHYETLSLSLAPGEGLILFTNGVAKALNGVNGSSKTSSHNTLFHNPLSTPAPMEHPFKIVWETLKTIQDKSDASPTDDTAILAVRRNEAPSCAAPSSSAASPARDSP